MHDQPIAESPQETRNAAAQPETAERNHVAQGETAERNAGARPIAESPQETRNHVAEPETAERNGSATPKTAERNAAQRPLTPLETIIGRIARQLRAATDARPPSAAVAIESLSAPAFRALVAERLRSLERDTAEIRTRINGLMFLVAGAVLSQLALRLLG